ncbi:four helix bundle protein [Ruficoccus amylovorans]|uniref:Four helix bundle protein n=1 Tax=Ruficoccus amylovorans TaxID=1804625 RepID=A0A842HAC1_9BACT|nr:four helix bundle protein [Ruficoccus amylovorans]MBC2593079.1 four helix bundle protein [Ruficoccus amylovorans]
MASIRTFEEIQAWQKARELSRLVYALTSAEPVSRDFALCDQIRRSSISAMSNIAEGFGRSGNREFLQFLYVARGSLAEVKSQLYVMLDADYINQVQFDSVYAVATEAEALLSGFIGYLSKSDIKGMKFKPTELREPETAFTLPSA